MAFQLPDLPYGFDALEPHIDTATMQIHHGKHHQTYVNNLNAAIENLRIRECIPGPKGVGFVNLVTGKQSRRAVERHPKAVETIKAWVTANGHDAAIWTALASNFHEPSKANVPFSVDAAVRYLETRDAHTSTKR